MERAFKGIWIPAEIWLNKELTLLEKVFLVEIDSLDNDEGCFASNEYFSNFFGLSKNRCSEIIKSLERKRMVRISYKYKNNSKSIEKRLIKVLDKSNRGIRNLDRGIRNLDRGYSENWEDNNTVFNNTVNNTTDSSEIDTKKELIESKTHLVLTKNMEKEIRCWNKDRLIKAIDIFNRENGKYFKLLKRIYEDNGNFVEKKQEYKKTGFHNFEETFTQYSEEELEKIIMKDQKVKYGTGV